LERVAHVLRCINPDIALLQEVADGWPAAGCDLQAERLAKETHLNSFAFAPEHRFRKGGYGNAVLTRFDIHDQHRVDLKIGWHKQRSALSVRITIGAGPTEQQIFATSLHLGLMERERREQLARLFESEHHHSPEIPSVLGGDFNDVFGTLEGRFMQLAGYDRVTERCRTFPAARPIFCLDAIYSHQAKVHTFAAPHCEHSRSASDHLPLVGEIEI
jgi:endonuclease/exonuclease/phosphatase family metal-dependent hydrolase